MIFGTNITQGNKYLLKTKKINGLALAQQNAQVGRWSWINFRKIDSLC